jgi:hypothetical protein
LFGVSTIFQGVVAWRQGELIAAEGKPQAWCRPKALLLDVGKPMGKPKENDLQTDNS